MTTRDAERTTGTPPPLIICARLSPLRKVPFCSLSTPPMLPLVYTHGQIAAYFPRQND